MDGSEICRMLIKWGEGLDVVRAMILTGSRALPGAKPDAFSDYDIELYVNDLQFFNNDEWLKTFGNILVCWPLEPMAVRGKDRLTRLVLYESRLKIDFQVTGLAGVKPFCHDSSYRVLIDKDGITKELPDPEYRESNVKKPAEMEFITVVNEFFWEAGYVAKSLWRDELYSAKYSLDYVIRFECLNKMIEWYIGADKNWNVDTKTNGRAFKKFLSAEDWQELESTYAGADIEENWKALFNVINFFRRIAKEVAQSLGYEYLSELDSKVTEYCRNSKTME